MAEPRRWLWRPSGRGLMARHKETWPRLPPRRSACSRRHLQPLVLPPVQVTATCRQKNCEPANGSLSKRASSRHVRPPPLRRRKSVNGLKPLRQRGRHNQLPHQRPLRLSRSLRPRNPRQLPKPHPWKLQPRLLSSRLVRRQPRRLRLPAARPEPTSPRGNVGMTAHRPPPIDRPKVIVRSGLPVGLKTLISVNGPRVRIKALPPGPSQSVPPLIGDLAPAVIVRKATARPGLLPAASRFAILP